MSKPGPNGISI